MRPDHVPAPRPLTFAEAVQADGPSMWFRLGDDGALIGTHFWRDFTPAAIIGFFVGLVLGTTALLIYVGVVAP